MVNSPRPDSPISASSASGKQPLSNQLQAFLDKAPSCFMCLTQCVCSLQEKTEIGHPIDANLCKAVQEVSKAIQENNLDPRNQMLLGNVRIYGGNTQYSIACCPDSVQVGTVNRVESSINIGSNVKPMTSVALIMVMKELCKSKNVSYQDVVKRPLNEMYKLLGIEGCPFGDSGDQLTLLHFFTMSSGLNQNYWGNQGFSVPYKDARMALVEQRTDPLGALFEFSLAQLQEQCKNQSTFTSIPKLSKRMEQKENLITQKLQSLSDILKLENTVVEIKDKDKIQSKDKFLSILQEKEWASEKEREQLADSLFSWDPHPSDMEDLREIESYYCNNNMIFVGKVLDDCVKLINSDSSWRNYIQRNVFGALGCSETGSFEPDTEYPIPGPDGGLSFPSEEAAQVASCLFAKAWFGGDQALLGKLGLDASDRDWALNKCRVNQITHGPGDHLDYAIGCQVRQANDHDIYGHGGWAGGPFSTSADMRVIQTSNGPVTVVVTSLYTSYVRDNEFEDVEGVDLELSQKIKIDLIKKKFLNTNGELTRKEDAKIAIIKCLRNNGIIQQNIEAIADQIVNKIKTCFAAYACKTGIKVSSELAEKL